MPGSKDLLPRTLAASISEALDDNPVVALLGPRQSGKTTLVRQLEPERRFFSLDSGNSYRTAREDPAGFIRNLPARVTLDEIQRVPELLPEIKLAVDADDRPGRFLLTGSANLLLLPKVTESLAGRMELVQLHSLTEAEKERRPGRFVQTLVEQGFREELRPDRQAGDQALAARLVTGGYPRVLARAPGRVRQWHRQYLREIIERDVQEVARIRDSDNLLRLLRQLAHRTAQTYNASRLARDLELQRTTVERYLSVLERLFLVRRLPAWRRDPYLSLTKAPKLHLLDSGLAATLGGLAASDWVDRRSRMGPLLESFAVQQIVAQAEWTDPDLQVWHYRENDRLEVDAVLTRGQEAWGVEVKASATASAGAGLARLAERCGRDFRGGVVLYTGDSTLSLGERLLAVPISELWRR